MSFNNPTYLWTLLGLIIPIIIHLWSKKEGKTIKVGSIQFLEESDSSQFSSIKLNEYLLLFTRLFLLAILSIILAEPQINLKTQNSKLTYIIEPSLLLNDAIKKIVDTLETDEPIRILKKGFPELDESHEASITQNVPNYWQLSKDMEQLTTDSIIVFAQGYASGLKGMRPAIKNTIEWILFDTEQNIDRPIKMTLRDDSLQIISVKSNSQYLSFEKIKLSQNHDQIRLNQAKDSATLIVNNSQIELAIENEDPLKVTLIHDEKYADASQYMEAAFNAISKHLDRPLTLNRTTEINALDSISPDLIVWLSDASFTETSVLQFIYKPNDYAQNIIEKGPVQNIYYLSKPINSETIINNYLPEKLLEILDLRQNIKHQIEQNDKRVVSKTELQPKLSNISVKPAKASMISISNWFWYILVVLMIAERLIAKLRKQ